MPRDKLLHFLIGFFAYVWLSLVLPISLVAVGVVLLAIGIEVWQKKTKVGVYDYMDAIFTITGGLVGMVYAALLP